MPVIDWTERVARHQEEAKAARARLHRARVAGGYSSGGPDAKRAVEDAIKIVTDQRAALHRSFKAADITPSFKSPSKVVPGDYVAVHAKVLLGIEAELAMALEEVAKLRANEAEQMARHRELAGLGAPTMDGPTHG